MIFKNIYLLNFILTTCTCNARQTKTAKNIKYEIQNTIMKIRLLMYFVQRILINISGLCISSSFPLLRNNYITENYILMNKISNQISNFQRQLKTRQFKLKCKFLNYYLPQSKTCNIKSLFTQQRNYLFKCDASKLKLSTLNK